MNERSRIFWFPALLVLLASMAGLRLLLQHSWDGALRPMSNGQPVWVLPEWMTLLAALGAAASWWVRRHGGTALHRVGVALIPAWALCLLLLVLFAVSLAVDRHGPLEIKALAFVAFFLSWVVLPGAALLAGALPFLRSARK